MSQVTKVEASVSTGTALVTVTGGEVFSLDVQELEKDGEGRAQVIEDSANGELANYLDMVALGTNDPTVATKIAARRDSANDWEVIYEAA